MQYRNCIWIRNEGLTKFKIFIQSYKRLPVRDGEPKAFGVNFERLKSIKKKYDPDNFFRMNNNIRPA